MGEQGCIFSKHIQQQFVALVLAKTSTFRWFKAPFVQVNVAMLVDLLLGQSGYSEKGQPLLAVISGSNDYSKSPLSKVTLADILWGPERLFRPLLPGRQHWFTKTKSTTILWRAMLPGRQHCYSQRRQAAGDELGLVTSQATMINHCCLTGYIASYLLSLWIPMLPAR